MDSQDPLRGASLADLGLETLNFFERVQAIDGTPKEWPSAPLATEAERFELWAVNLGLFVAGHGSLDYRLREAERLTQTIQRFLQELTDLLAEEPPVIQLHLGPESRDDNETDAETSDDSEPSENEDDGEEPLIELLVDGVRDTTDRLYKLSTKIRSPSSRLGSSRAATHQRIDEETGVDFLRAFEQADYDHIRSLFLQYQKSKSLQTDQPTEPEEEAAVEDDDGVWEPIRTVLAQHRATDSFLVGRIARANMRRRQQFAYWRKHREKLAHHARASISQQGPLTSSYGMLSRPSAERNLSSEQTTSMAELAPQLPSVTTATNLNITRLDVVETRSAFTVSEYAVSTWQPAGDAVIFPPPPRRQSDEKFFECPYCFTLCPASILTDKAWKAHLLHDLRPYICTYEDCRNPDQLYDSRQDWDHHENSCHRKLEAYRDHLRNDHGEYSDDASAARIIRGSESVFDSTDRPCPVCSIVLETPRAMHSHMALHLERFSLFSLPRAVALDDDDVSDAGSEVANGTIEDSRNEDFRRDWDI
ncbi:hypothetical protein B0T10DRAFT_419988, partial [Thelonectria olida]